MDDKITLFSNNIRGIKNSHARIKLLEYIQKNANSTGIVFLQEMYSSEKDEIKWRDEFKRQIFFSRGTTSSCDIAIGYFGTNIFIVEDIKTDKNGCLLLLDAKIDNQTFVLLNIYNANLEKELLITITELKNMLNNISNISTKQIILAGDVNFYFDLLLEAKGRNPDFKNNGCNND